MPTVYIPQSYTEGTSANFYYNKNGGGWWSPSQYDMVAIGMADQMYRAYLKIPPPDGITSGAAVTEVTLRFRRETEGAGDNGNNPAKWDIGLMASVPSQGFTAANFAYQIANDYSVSKGGSYEISIPPANWGAPNQTKYIAFIGYATSGCYGQIPVFTGSINGSGGFTNGPYPHCRITYSEGTLRYGTGGIYQQCEVYYGTGGSWVKVQPFYGTGGGWQLLGG
jgi:hypothetical protein